MRQRFIQSFSTSGDVQTAIDGGQLGKPYVAYLHDEERIDWNTMSPAGPEPEPEPLPEPAWVWSDIEDGKSLVFNDISDTCPVFVDNETYPDGGIAFINNNLVGGEHQNLLLFAFNYNDGYPFVAVQTFGTSGPDVIWQYFFDFEDGQAWSEQVTGVALTGETASGEDALVVSFDGQRTFTLTTADHEDGIIADVGGFEAPIPYACRYKWVCRSSINMYGVEIPFSADTAPEGWDEFTTVGVIKNTSSGEDVKIMVGPAETQPATGYSLMARLAVDGPSGEEVLWEHEILLDQQSDTWEEDTPVSLVGDGSSRGLTVSWDPSLMTLSLYPDLGDPSFPLVIERNYDKPLCKSGCE